MDFNIINVGPINNELLFISYIYWVQGQRAWFSHDVPEDIRDRDHGSSGAVGDLELTTTKYQNK